MADGLAAAEGDFSDQESELPTGGLAGWWTAVRECAEMGVRYVVDPCPAADSRRVGCGRAGECRGVARWGSGAAGRAGAG
ncbi:hypothetical protein, partial [Streptomyces hygroscopicus]|uniref:hypothetical protein n=1 Tax=Streptomyces hygroscopicus TaxID=1912 RepID=UPI001C65EBEF